MNKLDRLVVLFGCLFVSGCLTTTPPGRLTHKAGWANPEITICRPEFNYCHPHPLGRFKQIDA